MDPFHLYWKRIYINKKINSKLLCIISEDTAPASAVLERSGDEDDVVIKEEPPEVVELSSDEEKPNVAALEKTLKEASKSVIDEKKVDDKGIVVIISFSAVMA